jgi:hypothetical protein
MMADDGDDTHHQRQPATKAKTSQALMYQDQRMPMPNIYDTAKNVCASGPSHPERLQAAPTAFRNKANYKS